MKNFNEGSENSGEASKQERMQQIMKELRSIPPEDKLGSRFTPYHAETVMGNESRKRKLEAELKELEGELSNDQIENH